LIDTYPNKPGVTSATTKIGSFNEESPKKDSFKKDSLKILVVDDDFFQVQDFWVIS